MEKEIIAIGIDRSCILGHLSMLRKVLSIMLKNKTQ
jgi:hypothetical protein